MKIAHPVLSSPIELKENIVNVLVVENKKMFTQLVFELLEQVKGNDGEFVISEDDTPKDISKTIDLVLDVFTLDLNSKKILTKIYKDLEEIAIGADYYEKTTNLRHAIFELVDSIIQSSEQELICDEEFDIQKIFKGLNLRMRDEYDSLVEKITNYIETMSEIFRIKCFVLVNIKSLFNEEDLNLFYKQMFYKKINILLLESIHFKKVECEKIIIFDDDMCQIS